LQYLAELHNLFLQLILVIMYIAVKASEAQKEEWLGKPAAAAAEIVFIDAAAELFSIYDADVYFDLLFDKNVSIPNTGKPVFVNAVVELLGELPANCIRINAWNSFLKRAVTEIVAEEKDKAIATYVMKALGWKYIFAPDIRGMIAARSISMIINEAYYAYGNKVSSKEDIDTALKLGTNYPYGPFEWAKKIGLQNIYRLLNILSVEDDRYIAAPYLEQELTENTI
jgi:3-hydroxybutyryl-CoA dehydrogenase